MGCGQSTQRIADGHDLHTEEIHNPIITNEGNVYKKVDITEDDKQMILNDYVIPEYHTRSRLFDLESDGGVPNMFIDKNKFVYGGITQHDAEVLERKRKSKSKGKTIKEKIQKINDEVEDLEKENDGED